MRNRFLRFGVVGAIGFIVDASVLIAAVEVAHFPPLPARVLSFLVAATITFTLNQKFTFGLGSSFTLRRWVYYLATTAVGACINVGVYRLWILSMGAEATELVIGTALGSLTAMAANYFASSVLVFRPIDKYRAD